MLLSGQRRRWPDRRKCSAVPRYPWKGCLDRQASPTKEAHLDGKDQPKDQIPSRNAGDVNQIRTRDGQKRKLAFANFSSYFCWASGVLALMWTFRKTLMATLMHGSIHVREGNDITMNGTYSNISARDRIASPNSRIYVRERTTSYGKPSDLYMPVQTLQNVVTLASEKSCWTVDNDLHVNHVAPEKPR